jgi:predicted DNA-binding protein
MGEWMERRKTQFTTMITWAQFEALVKLANRRGVSMAQIVREALDQYLKGLRDEEK